MLRLGAQNFLLSFDGTRWHRLGEEAKANPHHQVATTMDDVDVGDPFQGNGAVCERK
jgi:hypothetical protein